ncbi:hypothetical protein CMT69_04795 [Elizabethkingia anophelis]|nr:hypothetical protein [Elizabethkingia anophelis]MDV3927951.1 hypothetical protein [Elizabethkingia anophelis]MDV3944245.1 hypothetical protein [Elizabethkingia anophelis]MDV4031997.1 hypothetical protein [Elizabethkingia anophelis]OPB82657.1 hypothetical protein BAX56_02935 [Elizabethkingia anophelis]
MFYYKSFVLKADKYYIRSKPHMVFTKQMMIIFEKFLKIFVFWRRANAQILSMLFNGAKII